jgi:hypothetical protein
MGLLKTIAKIGGAAVGFATGGVPGAIKGYQIGSSLGGMFGGSNSGGGTQQGNTANGAYYDPFASSRQSYADRLNTLMSASPQQASNLVMNTPGYMGGLRAGERELQAGLAKTGQVASGAEKIAFGNLGQDYFRKSYQDLYNQYSTLSGATQQPLNMASANQLGADQSRLQDQAYGQAMGALGDIFTSSGGGVIMNSNPSGYAAGATSYAPMDTNIGMGGYAGPANMGGGLVGPNWG